MFIIWLWLREEALYKFVVITRSWVTVRLYYRCVSLKEMTVMLSSQGIGFITVVAVSGCSVMLLALGCQKLLELKKESTQQHSCEERNPEGGLESPCSLRWRSPPVFSIADYYRKDDYAFLFNQRQGDDRCQEKASVSWSVNLDKRGNGMYNYEEENPTDAFTLRDKEENNNIMPASSMESENFCYETPSASSRALDSNETSQAPSAKKRNLGKKVRFSEDVVEPSGNNVEYRRRHTLAIRSRHSRTQGKTRNICTQNSASRKIDPTINSSSCTARSEINDSPASMDVSRKENSKGKMLAKPNIPPNRMALYNGISQYRSQRAALY